MKKSIYTICLLGILTTLSACSNEEQQQAAKQISHREELEKAEQVQGIVDEKTAQERQTTEETSE